MSFGLFRARGANRSPVRKPLRRSAPLLLEELEDRTAPALVSVGPGVFDPGTATWYLQDTTDPSAPTLAQFQYGGMGWTPVTGDWNGDGKLGIGMIDPDTMTWYLRNEPNAGPADAGVFQFGMLDGLPVVGDWDGNGSDSIGIVDPATMTWYLRNGVGAGPADAGQFVYGMLKGIPVVGDWTGAGHDGIGVVDPATMTWYLRNGVGAGPADAGVFQFGMLGGLPRTGDWNSTGHTGIGIVDPATMTWYLRNSVGAGPADAGQFVYGLLNSLPVANPFNPLTRPTPKAPVDTSTTTGSEHLVTLVLDPLNINLLGLQIQTNQIEVNVSTETGQGQLLGNLLTTVSNLVNLGGVNDALNTVLSNVVGLLNSTSLTLTQAISSTTGPLSTAPAGSLPVLDVFVAPVHLNLLGALVDTSPIHLTITANSGEGLVLGNVLTALANLFNPPLPATLNLDDINNRLHQLLDELNAQLPNVGNPTTTAPALGPDQVLSLTVPPINLDLLGLLLQTSQIQVNVNDQTGNGELLGNVVSVLLNTVGATPEARSQLSAEINALLAKVIGVLNASNLVLPANAVDTLSSVLQKLALPDLINTTGTATTPILDLIVASSTPDQPPVDVDLLGLIVTTSNIHADLNAETGDGKILGNLLYNVANLLNPGGALNLLTILGELAL